MSSPIADYTHIQVKSDRELVLCRPEMYVGAIDMTTEPQWVLEGTPLRAVNRQVTYISALLKLFDEAIVNARDHAMRMETQIALNVPNSLPVTYIDVKVDPTDGAVVITNDGNGMDVSLHPDVEGVYTPEVAFAHLRSSSHYDTADAAAKNEISVPTTVAAAAGECYGGQNGHGVKLCFIWSTWAQVETVDHIRKLKYTQTFRDNLSVIDPPVITKVPAKTKPYTKVSFRPDMERLKSPFTPDMFALVQRRTYDIAAATPARIKVRFNDELVPVKNFTQYVDLFLGAKTGDTPRVSGASKNGRWEYVIAPAPNNEFAQVSFVNGICAYRGGTHIKYILDQITDKLVPFIEKKKKVRVSPAAIREQLMIFVRCDIVGPKFGSGQTKEALTNPLSQLKGARGGGGCPLPDASIEKIGSKLGVMETACAITEAVDRRKVAKESDGRKTKRVTGIPKLDDANQAGGRHSAKCTLFLTEGDSAYSACKSGFSAEDSNWNGIFPLKGKLENLIGHKSGGKFSEEVTNIMKALGLRLGATYESADELRYGHIVFVTDQDLDGSHIKGLGIAAFFSQWPSLFRLPNFLGYMNTPIVKVWPKREKVDGPGTIAFYHDGEYTAWKEKESNGNANALRRTWNIKYYKGLGTSVKREFQEYMRNKRIVHFIYTGNMCDDAIDMAFNKKRSDDRKEWIRAITADSQHADMKALEVSYADFTNLELVWFSKYDCMRNIPSLVDGLKPGMRKIIFSCLKRKLTDAIKVAQLAGYTSEHSAYHHGEESLVKTIVGLAQIFLGASNLSLLVPDGQFGTRLAGGSDFASPRYIFTCLDKIVRTLIPSDDSAILEYVEDDGLEVEPRFYIPVVPLVLLNGSKGIGTGFSTDVPSYSMTDIAEYLRNTLCAVTNDECPIQTEQTPRFEAIPSYVEFRGTVTPSVKNSSKYIIRGCYEFIDEDTFRITELPVGVWTVPLIEHINNLITPPSDSKKAATPSVVSLEDNGTDSTVCITISLVPGKLATLRSRIDDEGISDLEKLFKLTSSVATSNMHLYNSSGIITKYSNVNDIMWDYIPVRWNAYVQRKRHLQQTLIQEIETLSTKVRFLKSVISGKLELRGRPTSDIVAQLVADGYPAKTVKAGKKKDAVDEEDNEQEAADEDKVDAAQYEYLLGMRMGNLTQETSRKWEALELQKRNELEELKATTIVQMWLRDLDALESAYRIHLEERVERQRDLPREETNITKKTPASKASTTTKKRPKAKAVATAGTITAAFAN